MNTLKRTAVAFVVCCAGMMAAALEAPGLFSPASQAAQTTAQPSFAWAADVPLLDCDGMPCIEARIGDAAPVRLLIDIGDQSSVLDTDTAKTLGLKPYVPDQPNWPKNIFRAVVPSVRIQQLALSNVQILTMGVTEMVAQNQLPHAQGLLAYTAFKDRALQMDFRVHRLRISEVLSAPVACVGVCDSFSLITFGKHGPPIVVAEGFTINGHPVTAQIDSQYSGSLLVYTASIEKLGLSEEAKATQARKFPFTDGGVKMKYAPAQDEGFKGVSLARSGSVVYFPTPGVHEPDGLFDATVGLELFRDAILTLDFHNMTVSVQKELTPEPL